jgi:hypothetical protein
MTQFEFGECHDCSIIGDSVCETTKSNITMEYMIKNYLRDLREKKLKRIIN